MVIPKSTLRIKLEDLSANSP